MGKIIKKKIQGMSWWMKTGLVLTLTLVATLFMYSGFYKPKPVAAAQTSKQGTFTKNTVAGAQSITGLGFQPKAIIFYWTKQTAAGYIANTSAGYGFAANGTPITMAAVSNQTADNAATTDANAYHTASAAIALQATASGGAINTLGTVTAFGADGFTVSWSAAGQADVIHYLALGGTDITNAYVGTTNVPAATTGALAVTGTGFQPDTSFFISAADGITLDTITASLRNGLTFGFMSNTTGTLLQGSVASGARDARTATGYVGSTWSNTSLKNVRGAALDFSATWTSWDADGFTLNVGTAATAATPLSYLALKGGRFKLGTLTQPTATGNQSVTGVGYQPTAVLFAGAGLSTATDVLNTTAGTTGKQTFGAGAATQSGTWIGTEGALPSDENMYYSTTAAITHATSQTTNSQASLTSLNADGFTLNWATADTTARNLLYIAIGQAPGTAPTLTTPTAASIGSTTATLGANVTSDGGAAVTERGVVWNTSTAPTTANNKVIGTGTTGVYTVSATSLPAGTRIYYRGYAINSVGTSYSATEGSFYTEPATQASAVNFSSVTQTGMTVNWTRGSGAGVIVVMKSGSAVTSVPTDGVDTTYTANAAFASGYQFGATGEYVVYKGTGTSVAVTGLSSGTTYHVAVYEYSGTGNDASPALGINYLTSPATGNQLTPAPCVAATPTALSVGAVTTSSVPLSWTAAAGDDTYSIYRNGLLKASGIATTSYTDSTAAAGTTYSYTITGDSTAGSCSSAQTAPATANTLSNTPSAPTVSNTGTGTSLTVAPNSNGNGTATTYAIRINGGAYTNQYVQAGGAIGASAVWQTQAAWGTTTISGLTGGTTYTFDVIARNGDLMQTAYGPTAARAPSVTLSASITTCNGCHGNPPVDNAARVGGVTGQFQGSHNKHSGSGTSQYAYACTTCHTDNGANLAHAEGNINMSMTPGSYSRGTSFAVNNTTFSPGTCSATYCHSNGTGGTTNVGETRTVVSVASPLWGGTTTCATCHGKPPAYANYTSATPVAGSKANAHMGTTHAAQICTTCHDSVTTADAGATYATTSSHANGVYNLNASLGYTYNVRRGGTCATPGCHGTVNWGGKLGCVNCHNTTYVRTKGRPGKILANAVGEFGLAWGHKKTGRTTVSDADCIVCHLEGVYSTGKTSATYHQDGNIDLRDPDGAGETPITDITGAVWTFQRFSTSYAANSRSTVGHTLNNIDNIITQKFCLKCHDSNGASNPTARSNNGGTGTNAMPFGGVALGANYTALNGAIGTQGTINVFSQFSSGNSSVHPVRKPLNRNFPIASRLVAPYNSQGAGRVATGGVKSLSVVMNCFDCHNTPTTPLTTRTVSAHGNAATLRGTVYVVGMNLCAVCHSGYTVAQNHGSGSAMASLTGRTGEGFENACYSCHGDSGDIDSAILPTTVRPVRAQNYHGFNTLVGGVAKWPAAAGGKPYGFIRNTVTYSGATAYHRPLTGIGELATGSATCMGGAGCAGNGSARIYTPGGQY